MSEIKVLITDGMAKPGVEILEKAGKFDIDLRKETPADELKNIIGNYETIVIRSATTLTSELIEAAQKMKLIVRAGAGVDNINVEKARELKIPVMNTASANSLAAAEHTIALMLSMFRQIPQSAVTLKEGRWDRKLFKGREVTGKTLGVVGLGNIGRLVVERAVGLKMNVVAYDPFVKDLSQISSLNKMDESIKLVPKLDDLLPHADVLTIHVPKSSDTKAMINADRIGQMKDGAFLINCARGGIVDEPSVLSALESGKLTSAAFDVFEKEPPDFPQPIFNHPKVVCTPHLGASTFEAQERVALTAAEQMVGFFLKGDKRGII